MAKSGLLLAGDTTRSRVTGQRLAFDALIAGLRDRQIEHIVIDKSPYGKGRTGGRFSVRNAAQSAFVLVRYLSRLPGCATVYNVLAPSKLGFFRDLALIWPARLLGKRIIVHMHGGGYDQTWNSRTAIGRWLVRRTLAAVDVIIVLGERLIEQFDFVGPTGPDIAIVPNGLPNEVPTAGRADRTYDPTQPFRILYLSNMIESKGYRDVLTAARTLSDEDRPIQVDFCGEFVATVGPGHRLSADEARERFLSTVDDWGLASVVTWHGIVRGDDKLALLDDAHAFVLPTNYPWEGQPISIIEAMAVGLPVISTDYRGIPELVDDQQTGILVPWNDPGSIARAISSLMDNPDVYRDMSVRARQKYEAEFKLDRHIERMVKLLDNEGRD